MKAQRRRDWLDDVFDYESRHPVAFASPRALVEARLIAEMDKARLLRRRTPRNGAVHQPRRRNSAAA